MAKFVKAVIGEYKGENTALAKVDGKEVVVKIPVNVPKPIPGSTVGVCVHPTAGKAQILVSAATEKKPAKFEEYDRYLYDPEAK